MMKRLIIIVLLSMLGPTTSIGVPIFLYVGIKLLAPEGSKLMLETEKMEAELLANLTKMLYAKLENVQLESVIDSALLALAALFVWMAIRLLFRTAKTRRVTDRTSKGA